MSRVPLQCPACNASLLVPESAAGRRARCSKCQSRFVVPDAEELLDIQIAQMAREELGQRWHENETENETENEVLAAAVAPPPRPRPKPKTVGAHEAPTGDTVMGLPAPAPTRKPAAKPAPKHDATPAAKPPPPKQQATPTPPATRPPPSAAAPTNQTYRDDPSHPPDRPYLVVRNVEPHGVLFAFEARWLRHRGFQTSLPKRCAHSGETKQLTARPVVAKNRTHDTTTRARAIEMHYEQDVGSKFSPCALIDTIARLEGVKEPFDAPLLYYAGAGHTNDALACRGTRAADGTALVEIQIPHGEVALSWLQRINGVCDPACDKLQADIDGLGSNAWLAVPEKIRQRLEAWCHFERGEKFLIYLRDADMTTADAGLGGIVVTDRRLLYHKYRQSLSISLNQETTLHVRTDDRIARLTLESHGRMTKAGKIARSKINALVDALSDAPRLRVTVGKK